MFYQTIEFWPMWKLYKKSFCVDGNQVKIQFRNVKENKIENPCVTGIKGNLANNKMFILAYHTSETVLAETFLKQVKIMSIFDSLNIIFNPFDRHSDDNSSNFCVLLLFDWCSMLLFRLKSTQRLFLFVCFL